MCTLKSWRLHRAGVLTKASVVTRDRLGTFTRRVSSFALLFFLPSAVLSVTCVTPRYFQRHPLFISHHFPFVAPVLKLIFAPTRPRIFAGFIMTVSWASECMQKVAAELQDDVDHRMFTPNDSRLTSEEALQFLPIAVMRISPGS